MQKTSWLVATLRKGLALGFGTFVTITLVSRGGEAARASKSSAPSSKKDVDPASSATRAKAEADERVHALVHRRSSVGHAGATSFPRKPGVSVGARSSGFALPAPRTGRSPVFTPPPRPTRAVGKSKAARRRRVVLDPGHGGHDPGAKGVSGLWEKNVTLAVAKEVKAALEGQRIEVLMTRESDKTMPLAARTAFANHTGADVFVSIHANAAVQPHVRGIETYVLDTARDAYTRRLAALENHQSEAEVSDLQLILADLSSKANAPDARALAESTQAHLVESMRRRDGRARDLGVKGSLFYVLLGAHMPSILVETAFLTNRGDASLLLAPESRKQMAQSIARGIEAYLTSHPVEDGT